MAGRRGHNEGSIYQRANTGKWVASLSIKDATGKVKRVTRIRDTRQEAARALRELQRQQDDGHQLGAKDPTLHQYLSQWLETSQPSVRYKTYTNYQSIVEGRITPHIGGLKLSKVTPAAIQGLYAVLADGGLSPRSVVNTHAVLRRALNQAVKLGSIVRNPCDAVDSPRAPRPEMKTLTREQADAFLDFTRDDRYHALYALALTSGMRLGELLGLKWEDVDFEGARLSVRRALQHQKGRGYVFVEPKTKSSRRTINLSQGATSALREHRTRQIEERLAFEDEWRMPELVFANEWGAPLDGGWMTTRFKGVLERGGFPVIRFHDLRHTAATLLLGANVHVKLVSEMLGHSSIALTLDTYSHVIPTMHQHAASVMDELFGT